MLRATLALLTASVTFIATVPVSVQAAEKKPPCNRNGFCLWEVEVPGGGGSDRGGGTSSGGTGAGVNALPTKVIEGDTCVIGGRAASPPPQGDAVWAGHTDGAIYECHVGNGQLGASLTHLFWSATAPAPPPPDPRVLAQRAVAAMNLQAIDIGIVPEDAPGRVGVIGMPTWMWAGNPSATTMGPITRTASAGGYTVTATAKVTKVVWKMGDGATVTCAGPGTPYADSYGKRKSPTCGHTYTRQGRYTVTATSHWTVEWAGVGQTGTMPLDLSRSTTIAMGEVQVLVQ